MSLNGYKNIYQEMILAHNKSPKNFRIIPDPSHEAHGDNPLCGDKVDVYLYVNGENIVEDIAFQGDGCAISKASASIMTTVLKGKTLDEVEIIFREFHDMSTGKLDPDKDPNNLGKLKIFAGVRDLPSRVKCATLAWHTMDAALKGKETTTTE